MEIYRPSVGFHFNVNFESFPSDQDISFQEVSGLTVDLQTEDFVEGGENRFTHKLPIRTNYSDVTLKRGLMTGSALIQWVKRAIENFDFHPTNLTLTLLNEQHTPLTAWHLVHAYPIQWSVSDFNAEASSVVVETLKLNYQFFRSI